MANEPDVLEMKTLPTKDLLSGGTTPMETEESATPVNEYGTEQDHLPQTDAT